MTVFRYLRKMHPVYRSVSYVKFGLCNVAKDLLTRKQIMTPQMCPALINSPDLGIHMQSYCSLPAKSAVLCLFYSRDFENSVIRSFMDSLLADLTFFHVSYKLIRCIFLLRHLAE